MSAKRMAYMALAALAGLGDGGTVFDSSQGRPMTPKMLSEKEQERHECRKSAMAKAEAKRGRRKRRNRNNPF